MADKQPVISDDVVVQHALPRPSICLKARMVREVRLRARWRICKQ